MTRRITIGPINRVEGDLELHLEIDGGHVRRAEVRAPIYRGFEQILEGRSPWDALALVPRICGICSVSQSIAAATMLRQAAGCEIAPNGLLATNIAHAAENAADHLTHFYLFFMPDFARACYQREAWHGRCVARFAATKGSAAAEMLPARARLIEIMGIVAGKWPHSIAFQPGGTTRALDLGDHMRLVGIATGFRAFLEGVVFADQLENVLALSSEAELWRWRERRRGGDFARFLEISDALSLEKLGRGPGLLMSYGACHGRDSDLFAPGIRNRDGAIETLEGAAITEDVSHSWLRDSSGDPALASTVPDPDKPKAYSWCKAPRYAGQAAEVGAVARQAIAGHGLIRALVAAGGTNVRNRVIARIIETAALAVAIEQWVSALVPAEPFCLACGEIADGSHVGLVEAARGGLGHWMAVKSGRIERYQIIAPTTWNFSPRDRLDVAGPLEQALEGTDVGVSGASSVAVQHVLRSFDPCMMCTTH
ncbi:MAG: nickel-dependent hydrogenase large subunit [Alphaproteobacteria bacterium]|nr:nickel-dependent hydrogenase large subunit [Alphaproteobacteria bacterium]